MEKYDVIDADGHVEPAIAVNWEKYAPPPYGTMLVNYGMDAFDRNGDTSALYRGGWDPSVRLEDMTREGIHTSVLFGGVFGLSPRTSEDPGFGPAFSRAYNDWLHDYCSEDPRRLKAAAILPMHDIPESCKEAERATNELGAVGIVCPPFLNPNALDNPRFFPLYEVVESLDTPLLVHGPGGDIRAFLATFYHSRAREHAIDFPVSIMMASMDMICGGVFERFKKLKVAFLESGVGWMPWWLNRLDEHFEKLPHHMPNIDRKPSELFRKYVQEGRAFWSCEPDEEYLPFVLKEYGEDFIIYASDYPHWDSIFPESVNAIANREEISPEHKYKVLNENPRKLYGKRIA